MSAEKKAASTFLSKIFGSSKSKDDKKKKSKGDNKKGSLAERINFGGKNK